MEILKILCLKGGGKIFGPKPRNYHFKLNKKLKRLARVSALSYKAKEKEIIVVEDFTFENPKTKAFVAMLNNLDLKDKKVLLVLKENDKNIILSSRNLQKAKITRATSINTYDVLNANRLLIAESSLEEIQKLHTDN